MPLFTYMPLLRLFSHYFTCRRLRQDIIDMIHECCLFDAPIIIMLRFIRYDCLHYCLLFYIFASATFVYIYHMLMPHYVCFVMRRCREKDRAITMRDEREHERDDYWESHAITPRLPWAFTRCHISNYYYMLMFCITLPLAPLLLCHSIMLFAAIRHTLPYSLFTSHYYYHWYFHYYYYHPHYFIIFHVISWLRPSLVSPRFIAHYYVIISLPLLLLLFFVSFIDFDSRLIFLLLTLPCPFSLLFIILMPIFISMMTPLHIIITSRH